MGLCHAAARRLDRRSATNVAAARPHPQHPEPTIRPCSAPRPTPWPRPVAAALLVALAVLAGGCAARAGAADRDGTLLLRLGYLPNLTHAAAIAGVDRGFLADALGDRARLEPSVFTAGPAVVEALFGGSIDAAYLGPTPAINAFARSRGEAVRVVAGATSGGASLVVRPGIAGPPDLRGATLATPQLGNTQDVALRRWLGEQGLSVDTGAGSGDVAVAPVESATALDLLRQGRLDGAWVPEPWASRMVAEAGAVRLLDERDLWPGGAFPTTVLVVSLPFARAHPDVVDRLLEGHVATTLWLQEDPVGARTAVADGLEALVGMRLPDDVVADAWSRLSPTVDPHAGALQAGADHAADLGFSEPLDLAGALDLTALDRVLTARGLPLPHAGRLGRRGPTPEPVR